MEIVGQKVLEGSIILRKGIPCKSTQGVCTRKIYEEECHFPRKIPDTPCIKYVHYRLRYNRSTG